MSIKDSNQTYREQQKKLVRATFKKAFINAIHISARTVDVYYAENPQSIIKNIPVATSVDIAGIMLQQKCRIDVFDETNPNDCVCAYTY